MLVVTGSHGPWYQLRPGHAQVFKAGQAVRARVVGARPMDGLAVLSLKPSVVDLGVASYADVRPGALMRGTVASVEDYGIFVALTPSVKCVSPPSIGISARSCRSLPETYDAQDLSWTRVSKPSLVMFLLLGATS